jgi:SAM-dependent methyltransferase
LQESAENSQIKTGETAGTLQASCSDEMFVPGRPPDPSLTRVGSSNVCPGCQSAEIRTLCRGEDVLCRATERLFLIVECKECRMVRLYPRPDPEELRRFYPLQEPAGARGAAPGFWKQLLRRFLYRDHAAFVRRALAEVPGEGPVLDVNCGTGLFLRELNLPQNRLVGLDYSSDSAATAWARNAVPAVCGALPSAPFPAATFSLITMFQVLEHLYDPSVYIQAAAQLLRPDGRLIVQVPNASSWQFLLLGERWSGLDIPRHLLFFKEEDLGNLLEFCGFEIVRQMRFSLKDDPSMLAKSLAPGLSPEVRRLRGTEENQVAAIAKSLLFGLLWLLALPIAALESACCGGATLTIEARLKRASSNPS